MRSAPTDRRVDWFRVVTDLDRAGLSLRDIQRATGIPRATMNDWCIHPDRSPAHHRGELLLTLWLERTGNVRDSVPMLGHTRPRPVSPVPTEATS